MNLRLVETCNNYTTGESLDKFDTSGSSPPRFIVASGLTECFGPAIARLEGTIYRRTDVISGAITYCIDSVMHHN